MDLMYVLRSHCLFAVLPCVRIDWPGRERSSGAVLHGVCVQLCARCRRVYINAANGGRGAKRLRHGQGTCCICGMCNAKLQLTMLTPVFGVGMCFRRCPHSVDSSLCLHFQCISNLAEFFFIIIATIRILFCESLNVLLIRVQQAGGATLEAAVALTLRVLAVGTLCFCVLQSTRARGRVGVSDSLATGMFTLPQDLQDAACPLKYEQMLTLIAAVAR